MDWDRLPVARRIAKRDRLLVRYLREEVHPFSATEAGRLDGAGLVSGKVRSADDLGRLAPVDPAAVDGLDAVLRPTAAGLSASPDRFRWWWASATGRRATFVDEEIEPRFRTIHFDDHGDLLVASSAADLDRLADLGRRALGLAGVRRDDAVVTLLPARGDLAFWTVTLGCRRSGVAALHLGEAAAGSEVAGYAPSVLVGTATSLRRVAEEDPEVAATVGLVLAAERLTDAARAGLAERYPGADVRALWSPPGVRAPWVECTAGRLHTWPDAEIVQLVDGIVVWTPLGWRGTVVLRLRTGVRARLRDEPCACGATSTRIELAADADAGADADVAAPALPRGRPGRIDHGVMADEALADAFFAEDPAAALASYTGDEDDDGDGGDDEGDPEGDVEGRLAAVLDGDERVGAWTAEVDGAADRPHLVVWLAPVVGQRAALEADLARLGDLLGADRVVVERPSVVRQRLEAADGARVGPPPHP